MCQICTVELSINSQMLVIDCILNVICSKMSTGGFDYEVIDMIKFTIVYKLNIIIIITLLLRYKSGYLQSTFNLMLLNI